MRESTVINAWIDEGRAKGIDEGRAKGIDEGRVQTLRENIRTTLTTRFGAVSAEFLRLLDESTDVGQLDRAFRQALTVKSAEDVRL